MVIRKKKPEALPVNPVTGRPVKAIQNRIRTNLQSIYNRGNPFSPIQEESSEDNRSSSGSSVFKSSGTFSNVTSTFLSTSGTNCSDIKSSSNDAKFPSDCENKISTNTLTSSFNSDALDLSAKSTLLNQSLNKFNFDSKFNNDCKSKSINHLSTVNKFNDQCLNDLMIKKSNDFDYDNSKLITDNESKQLHGVIRLRNLLVNVNVRVGYRDSNNAVHTANNANLDQVDSNKLLNINDFNPNLTSTPSKFDCSNDVDHKSVYVQTDSFTDTSNVDTITLDKSLYQNDKFAIKDHLNSVPYESAESTCSSFASSDLTYVKRGCRSLNELELDQINRMSAITVAVRVRPFSRSELLSSNQPTFIYLDHNKNQVELMDRNNVNKLKYLFKFDYCFGHPYFLSGFDEQLHIYERIGRPYIEHVFKGFNLCYFAYGQTGTGKSYTIMGDQQNPGLITRFARDLFTVIDWYQMKRKSMLSICDSTQGNRTFIKENTFSFDQDNVGTAGRSNSTFTVCPDTKTSVSSDDDFVHNDASKLMSNDEHCFNIIPMSKLHELFCLSDTSVEIKITLEISFYEIYNERIYDLLDESNQQKHIAKVREHPNHGPYIVGLTTKTVDSIDQLLYFYNLGTKRRSTSSNSANDHSSRSHAILTINCVQEKMYHYDLNDKHLTGKSVEQIRSKINFVDLAGSERASIFQSTGNRLKEGNSINKSLLTLGQVINKLSQINRTNRSMSVPCLNGCTTSGTKDHLSSSGSSICRCCSTDISSTSASIYVPYRDSILTWLLKDCLGGNSKTIMVATVSPHLNHHDQTLCTLRYAHKATKIMNHLRINHSYIASTSRHPHLIHPEVFKHSNIPLDTTKQNTPDSEFYSNLIAKIHSNQFDQLKAYDQTNELNLVERIRIMFSHILDS